MENLSHFGTARRLFALALIAIALGCGGEAVTEVTSDALVSDPDAYDGKLIRIVGDPTSIGYLTGVACDTEGPCNNLWGPFRYGDVELVPADPDAFTKIARGYTPLSCYDDLCTNGVTMGCHGNDLEAYCAPAVPSRIEAVTGILDGRTLYVEELELSEGFVTTGLYRDVE